MPKILNASQLKIIALVSMLVDHFAYFFSLPVYCRWIGRLAAPIFLYLLIQSAEQSRHKMRFLCRVYGVSVGMGLINYWLAHQTLLVRADGITPNNSILSTFFLILITVLGVQLIQEKRNYLGILLILLPLILPFIIRAVLPAPLSEVITRSLVPSLSYAEGGILWYMLGIILYLFRHDESTSLFIMAISYCVFFGLTFIWSGVTIYEMFHTYYGWMHAFAVIPLFMYNGKRGTAPKWLFYFFYPVHIYLLFIISCQFF